MNRLLVLLIAFLYISPDIKAQVSSYDHLNRKTAEFFPDGTEVLYTWDKVGNLIGIVVQNPATLPVELLEFSAQPYYDDPYKNQSLLEWVTATEVNNEKFIIETSVDGTNFVTIGEVQGSGNSTGLKMYDFIHTNPVIGENYYRLKQIDFNGQYEYSEIRVVVFTEGAEITVNLYPNPASSFVTLEVESETQASEVSMIDVLGKVMDVRFRRTIKNTWQFDASPLPSGTYYVLVQLGRDILLKQLIVK